MDTTDVLKPIAKIGGAVGWFGIGLVILGGLSIWSPQISGLTVSVIVGVLLIIGRYRNSRSLRSRSCIAI